jgi:hypothetical protein
MAGWLVAEEEQLSFFIGWVPGHVGVDIWPGTKLDQDGEKEGRGRSREISSR